MVDLSQVLRMVPDTFYRAVGFSHVVFCLCDAKGEQVLTQLLTLRNQAVMAFRQQS